MRVTGIGLHRSSTSFNPSPVVSLLFPLSSPLCFVPQSRRSACFFNAKCSLLFVRVYGRFGRGDRPTGRGLFSNAKRALRAPTHCSVCAGRYVSHLQGRTERENRRTAVGVTRRDAWPGTRFSFPPPFPLPPPPPPPPRWIPFITRSQRGPRYKDSSHS